MQLLVAVLNRSTVGISVAFKINDSSFCGIGIFIVIQAVIRDKL